MAEPIVDRGSLSARAALSATSGSIYGHHCATGASKCTTQSHLPFSLTNTLTNFREPLGAFPLYTTLVLLNLVTIPVLPWTTT
jgi:hypothetical protein